MIYSIHVEWHDPDEPEMIGTLLCGEMPESELVEIKRRICKEMLDAGYAAVPHTYMRLHRQHRNAETQEHTGEPIWHIPGMTSHLST